MQYMGFATTPAAKSYDVVIIGGAIMGSSLAWHLTHDPSFQGSVLVIERDPSYAHSSTAHTNSCIRQQFSTALNVQVSQFGAEVINNFRDYMGGDARVPEFSIQNYGYLYLADNESAADVLRRNQEVQLACGAQTRLLSPEEIAQEYPFYNLDDVVLGSINTKDEGYWDGGGVFDWFRRGAQEGGAEYCMGEVTAITRAPEGGRVQSVTLKDGSVVACGTLVNAAGPRAARIAQMAGVSVPVEPRKRFTYIFSAEQPLSRDLPLTIDPSGVHVRQDGPKTYLAGAAPDPDPAVDPDDFEMDHSLWQEHVWPILAQRIPQFEAIKIVTEWAGHYAYNTLDQNAVLGPHPELENFLFINGFSGHGLQQSPAMGRGLAEWITYGGYRNLDMTPFHYDRILSGQAFLEKAVI